MRPYQDRLAAQGRCGVAAIGVAQEFQPVWTAYQRAPCHRFAAVHRAGCCVLPVAGVDGSRVGAC
jgi:hypothetical protein